MDKLSHTEIWTIDDLIEYARENGFSLEITKLTDTKQTQ
jgi:hypothetical protein